MRLLIVAASCVLLGACATTVPRIDRAQLEREVADTERAFARTMAERNHEGFVGFLAEETVFFGAQGPLRGRAAVAAAWKGFYEAPEAPFSWAPEQVQVLDSGTLALSSGPVYDPQGERIASFTSIWRREAPGTWRIVFDKGCDACRCRP